MDRPGELPDPAHGHLPAFPLLHARVERKAGLRTDLREVREAEGLGVHGA